MLVKHRNFTWRNGSQEMSATESRDLSAAEIEAVRTAMGGITISGATTAHELNEGTLIQRIDLVGS